MNKIGESKEVKYWTKGIKVIKYLEVFYAANILKCLENIYMFITIFQHKLLDELTRSWWALWQLKHEMLKISH